MNVDASSHAFHLAMTTKLIDNRKQSLWNAKVPIFDQRQFGDFNNDLRWLFDRRKSVSTHHSIFFFR